MSAADLYKAGKLQDAIDAQIQEVKSHPADHSKRLFLFELLAFAGDVERARKQIDVVQYGEIDIDAAVMEYRQILDAEEKRRRLFSESLKPEFFDEPPEHVQHRLEAVNRLRENQPAEALQLLEQANAPSHAVKGELNEKAFQTLRDCDDLFAGILEVMSHGNYYWVPLDHVCSLLISPPKFPRDLIWRPAKLELVEATGDVFLPTLYPGSHEHADDQVRLGRLTDWKESESGPVLGVGQHMYLADDDAVPLLEWKQLTVESGSA